MVHIKKCPLGKRGKPTTEFYTDGKPQIYCYGWIDARTDEPLTECKNCADWVNGEQCEKDFSERLKDIKKQLHCDSIDEKIAELKAEIEEGEDMNEYTKFINQKLEDSDFLKYDAGVITKCNIVGYPQKGAEDTFSIGQPMFDAEGCLLGYLGIGLFDSLNYSNDKGIRIPVECWVIELPTRHCEVGKKIFTYWQNEQRKAEIEK